VIDLEQIIETVVRRVVRDELERASKPRSEFVSIAQYAAERAISPRTVRAAIKAGRLGCIKAGRAWRVRADEEIAGDTHDEDDPAYEQRVLGGRK
jgi:hypothetical protein